MRKLLAYIFYHDSGPDDVMSRLQKYKGISNSLIGFGLFTAILYIKLEVSRYAGLSDVGVKEIITLEIWDKLPVILSGLRSIFAERWVDIIFFVFIWIWYRAYDVNADREIKILEKLYSDDKAPHDWSRITGGRLVPFLAIGITASFLIILLVSDNILVLCAVILLLLCQDAFGNNMLRRNILTHFYDPAFQPDEQDPLREVILERRRIALDYWVWRPQLSRIGLAMCATSLIAAVSAMGALGSFVVTNDLLHAAIAVMIICNELTIASWRIARDERFKPLDQKVQEIRRALLEAPVQPG